MRSIMIPYKELDKYRKGHEKNKIKELQEEIVAQIPKKLLNELKYRNIKLDYYTEPMEIPLMTIPYHFDALESSAELKSYLDKYIILVNWS